MAVLEGGTAFVIQGQREGVFVEGDPKQVVLTALGAHIVPFATVHLAALYTGVDPFSPAFVEARRTALRTQLRNMIVRK